KILCDSFAEGCEIDEVADEITLSVTDLSRVPSLMDAYEALGREALLNAVENPGFLPAMGRMADRAENYGGNSEEDGYTNMVDLGDLAKTCADLLPENSRRVRAALDDCIVYKINGPLRTESTGLSCYYSYNGDQEDYEGYKDISSSQAFTYLYGYELSGELDEQGISYLNDCGYEDNTVPWVSTLADVDEDFPVYIDSQGRASIETGPEIAAMLKGVYFHLAWVDEEQDTAFLLGRDNDLYADWEGGVFSDNFRDTWGSIDGNLVYMELVYEGEGYNAYSVPILLNGQPYNLRVTYHFDTDNYRILGARRSVDDRGMVDKNLRQLKPGDEVTTILYAATIDGADSFQPIEAETFTVTADTAFVEADLGDGEFVMMFELADVRNTTAWSELAVFTVENGMIYTDTDA
ncbi:MAG: hypothetical protein IJT94_03830, partial [Oscillibacter sp.]|nr:hypothetical protein [Oscillibacter sp.]